MINYIKNREEETDKKLISNEIAIMRSKYFEKDPMMGPSMDMNYVFKAVVDHIPSKFLDYIDTIVVGNFAFLEDRDLDALYMDSSIYLSNSVREEETDLIDDIIHETAHAVEENNESTIYGDKSIEGEFLAKRQQLYFLLKENGFKKEVDFYQFENPEYDDQFDMFLYQEVGYSLLASLTANLFCSSYGITSLREYFANTFENYFYVTDPYFVKDLCPAVFNKIEELLEDD